MSPDSQYLSSNSILSPFSQHLSPHPNNFTIQTTSTNPLHIYAESPRSTTNTPANLIGNNNQYQQLSRNDNILNNNKNNSNNSKSSETSALPNILATLDDLTHRRQNQKDLINKNDDIIKLIDRIDRYVIESNPNSRVIGLNNSKVEIISNQYVPPPAVTPVSINDDQNINNETSVNKLNLSANITTNNQQSYHQNLNDIQTSQSQNPLLVKVSTIENHLQQNLNDLPNAVERNLHKGDSNNQNRIISKLPSLQHTGQDNNRKYLNLPLNSPTPSLPEFDFLRRHDNTQHNNDINNLSSEICFKEPGSVASYYSAPAHLGSERILDDFAFPNFFRDNELNTPKSFHGNVDDFYTQQLHNFFEGEVMSFQNSAGEQITDQNCDNIETSRILNSNLETLNNSTSNVNNNSSHFINNNDSHHMNTNHKAIKDKYVIESANRNIFNSSIIDNNNDNNLDSNPLETISSQNIKSKTGNSKSHFKPPSLLDSNKMLLSQHYINKIILFECKLCGKYYKNERSYSKHQKTHGDDCPKCDICGKTFQSTKRLLNHDQDLCKSRQDKRIKNRTPDATIPTEVRDISSFDINLEANNNNNEIDQSNDNLMNIDDANNFNNMKMNDKYISSNKVSNNQQNQITNAEDYQNIEHQQSQQCELEEESTSQQTSKTNPKFRRQLNKGPTLPKKCKFCLRTFIREAHLRKHEKNHDVVFKCEHCPRSFRFKNACQAHMRVHTGEKPYKCNTCPAAFATSSNLKAHQLIHTDEKPFECTFGCGKAFSMKRLRKWHERTHTGEKPYHCEVCGKNFAMQSRLSLHRKQRHMDKNLRPHECSICLKRFLHPTGLRDHMNIHNGNRPYACPFDNCDKRFPNQNRLWEHKKLHSTFKRYTCQICNKSFIQYTTLLTHKKYCNSLLLSSSSSSL